MHEKNLKKICIGLCKNRRVLTLPPLPLAPSIPQSGPVLCSMAFENQPFFRVDFRTLLFSTRGEKRGSSGTPRGDPRLSRGPKKGPIGEKRMRAQRVFFRSGPQSAENASKAEIVVLPKRKHDFRGSGGSPRDPRRPPEVHKGAPGTAEKRKRREAEERRERRRFGETSEKRPEAKSKKKGDLGV